MISVGPLLRFHGGGHLNHSIFWQNLSPNGGGEPTGDLLSSINRDFGSFQNFKTILTNSTVAIQGSGWGWLGYNRVNKTLITTVCPNQDPLEPTTGILFLMSFKVVRSFAYLLEMIPSQASFHCSVSTSGSTLTTCSTRAAVPRTSTRSGTSSTGRMLPSDWKRLGARAKVKSFLDGRVTLLTPLL